MGYLKSKSKVDPQNLRDLKRDIKREVRVSAEKRNGCGTVAEKFSVKQGSEQSCVTQEKAGFSSACSSCGVAKRGDAGPVTKKYQRNVL